MSNPTQRGRRFKFRPSPAVVLRRIRRRYFRLLPHERPGRQPHNLCWLATAAEQAILSLGRRWPLTQREVRFITTPPAPWRRRTRRARLTLKIAAEIR